LITNLTTTTIIGPIVRINPEELHISDPAFQPNSSGLDKDSYFYTPLFSDKSVLGTVSAEKHFARRTTLAPAYTDSEISRFEPQILKAVEKLCHSIEEHANAKISRDHDAFLMADSLTALTTDLVAAHTLGVGFANYLSEPDFGSELNLYYQSQQATLAWRRQVPTLNDIFVGLPQWILQLIYPNILGGLKLGTKTDEGVRQVIITDKTEHAKRDWRTSMWESYRNPNLKGDRLFDRMKDEASAVVGHGGEWVGRVLSKVLGELGRDEKLFEGVMREVKGLKDGKEAEWKELARLPIFSSVIKESLRYDPLEIFPLTTGYLLTTLEDYCHQSSPGSHA
jgi:hypothetical protein